MADIGEISRTRSDVRIDPQRINILFLCDEWKSFKGGLSTVNRELATNMAKTSSDKIMVHFYVAQSDDEDRDDARKSGVNLLTAQKLPGTANPLNWLMIPPPELPNLDVVIGQGRKFGVPAYNFIKERTDCKFVQFLHVFGQDLGPHKSSKSCSGRSPVHDTIHEYEEKHKRELELCNTADAVVAVGPALQQKYTRCLPDIEVDVFTPGIIESFLVHHPRLHVDKEFRCLVCGRAANEDRLLKGYDILANAIGSLEENFKMTFVGSPPGEQRNIEQWFLENTRITREQLIIHSYADQEQLKNLFRESDVVALPSRIEAFGMVALEAISADIPVLISKKAGIFQALQHVEGGNSVIVESEGDWARRIQQLAEQNPEDRHRNAVRLRKNYEKVYSWEEQCVRLTRMILNMTGVCDPAEHDNGHEEVDERAGPMVDDENFSQLSRQDVSSSQRVSQGKRKRPRLGTGDELQNIAVELQATLWEHLSQIFGKSTLIECRGWRWGDISLQKDTETGSERLALKGGGSETNQGQGELESEECQSKAVKCYKEFESHRPPQMKKPNSPFYLAVKNKIKSGDPVWYTNKAQGVNKIGKSQPKKKRSKQPCL